MNNRKTRKADETSDVVEARRELTDDRSEGNLSQVNGVVIGILTGIDKQGHPLVAYAGNQTELPVSAKTTATVGPDAIGREVALLFEDGDLLRPIVIGVVQGDTPVKHTHIAEPTHTEESGVVDLADDTAEVVIDGQRIVLQAKQEVVLRCGKASITMTRAGKIIIRGAYVSTRSSGVNRIKGGSVQIN